MVILLVTLIFFAVIGAPLAFAIGLSSIISMLIEAPQFLIMLPQRIWSGSFSYVMVAMPLFILMGELMNEAGLTEKLIDFCMYLVRPIRGGLGEVNVVASIIFGGISGSSVADTSALGSVLIPAMEKRGYSPEFSAGITVASSTMGMIIPPSIPMIMYSMISGASIGSLFIAGLIPGVLVGVLQLVVCYVISRKRGYHPKPEAFDRKHFTRTLMLGVPAAVMPLVIIMTVSFGVATASESAAVAVLYSLILGLFFYRSLTRKAVVRALRRTLIASSSIVIIIGFSTIFTWQMTMQQVPQTIAAFFLSLNLPKWIMLAIFVVLILIIGTFIDVSPAILMLTPIMLPIMREIGVSDLQFGAMFITGLAIGLVTPPVGMCLNVCSKINGMPIVQIARGALPFILCNVAVFTGVAFIPALSTWLPRFISY
jgi:tripartite ATP-independent transporter DctM subunit